MKHQDIPEDIQESGRAFVRIALEAFPGKKISVEVVPNPLHYSSVVYITVPLEKPYKLVGRFEKAGACIGFYGHPQPEELDTRLDAHDDFRGFLCKVRSNWDDHVLKERAKEILRSHPQVGGLLQMAGGAINGDWENLGPDAATDVLLEALSRTDRNKP